MELYLYAAAVAALCFTAQLTLMRTVKRHRFIWFIPPAAVLLTALYGLLRMLHVIRYDFDGSMFFDTAELTGLVIIGAAIVGAAGCLLGFLADRMIVYIKYLKSR